MSDSNLIPLTMPKWGMAMEAGKVVEWLVSEGGQINKGDEILEVETEKIVNALEANDSGILSRCVAQPGDELPVGALLGVLSTDEVAADILDSFVNEFQSNFVPEESTQDEVSEPEKVELGDRTITYLNVPARNENGKLPVLMIHGFGSDRNAWLFNIAELSEERSLYLLDLPGCGSSSKDVGDGSLSFFSEIIIAFMDELGLQGTHVIGHSMGATIAATLAHTASSRVASLTLISGGGLGETINIDFINDFVSSERRKDMKPVLQKLFADPGLVTREMVNEVLKYKRIEGVADALKNIVAGIFPSNGLAADYTDTIGQLDMPITAIWGEQDQIAVLNGSNNIGSNIKFNVMADCGHVPHMEAAKKVNEIMSNSLKDSA